MSAAVALKGPGDRPRLLLCECAGTMSGIDFEVLAVRAAACADVLRERCWCTREGQARMLELADREPGRRLVLAGCAQDFADRRFHGTFERGVRLEVADIREACAWVHADEATSEVTDKAARIVECAVALPDSPLDRAERGPVSEAVVVIGGGIAGTKAAIELVRMGHPVELVERRPFLGGRAARIGTVYPTNDCGLCLPTTSAQVGVRKCFHRSLSVDQEGLRIWRRTEVESVAGRPGDFRVALRSLPNLVTDGCVACGQCEGVCDQPGGDGNRKAIHAEVYDGRVIRTIDLERCTFCGACANACPVGAIDLRQSPRRTTVRAGAVLVAVGCQPAPRRYLAHLGHGRPGVVSQTKFHEVMDEWEAEARLGRRPVDEVVIIQCAGSRDKRFLRYCSRLCCMIALKHATRLRTLFPSMRVRICYLELRAAGYENWYLAARRAGVEFIRGLPPEVQADEQGRPVVEVEDTTSGLRRVLRPGLVVLADGMVAAESTAELSHVLGMERDEYGFVRILDAKNRATETTREGVFVCGSASHPKALAECHSEASAAASEIHSFLASPGRLRPPASEVRPERCTGCDGCRALCPFGAISLAPRPQDAPRPATPVAPQRLAVIDPQACHACGLCAARCPELAVRHHLGDDDIFERIVRLTKDVRDPVVGFYCRECAGAAISLSGMRRDGYPSGVRLIRVSCLGRLNAVHIVEAADRGARGVFLAGCPEGRCHFRTGDRSAAEAVGLARELLVGDRAIPVELWHLCAVDRHSVGRRIRMFCDRTRGVDMRRAPSEDVPPGGVERRKGSLRGAAEGRHV